MPEPPHLGSASDDRPKATLRKSSAPKKELEDTVSVARVTEISSESSISFEDAIDQGIARANKTLRNVKGAWIKEQQVVVESGQISAYRVNMMVTFVLDDME
jgi:flavin-binding protein dodecin